MKVKDLPEKHKRFNLYLSNKLEYVLTGEEVAQVLSSKEQLVGIRRIEAVINKAYVVSISLDFDASYRVYESLPANERALIQEKTGDLLGSRMTKRLKGGGQNE